jgi:hypothetical protein
MGVWIFVARAIHSLFFLNENDILRFQKKSEKES